MVRKGTLAILLVLGAVVLLLGMPDQDSRVRSEVRIGGKPDPIVRIEPIVQPGSVAGTHRIQFRIESKVDCGDATYTVSLPDGVKVLEGSCEWSGSLAQGVPVIFELCCQNEQPGQILASIEVHLPNGTRAAHCCQVVLGDPPAGPQGVGKTNDRGEKIFEVEIPSQ